MSTPTTTAASIRAEAYASAFAVVGRLALPPGTALAATGSFARQEMTPQSDIDLILLHADGAALDDDAVGSLWYPVWDAKYHLDFAMRTPKECAAIAAEDASAGFAQLDLTFVAGERALFDAARAGLLDAWRRQLQRGFDAFIDSAIERWHRSGSIASMTNPELKNGRGGLRDIQLLRALALGNLCDVPRLDAERDLLLDVRTLLHVHARRHRDTLDPEFAADIAKDVGYADRYELSSAIVRAASAVDREVERGLAVARGVIGKRGRFGRTPRRPLDIDVIEDRGQITLSRRPNLEDPWLLTRVAAASARTGLPVAAGTWSRLRELPEPTERWPRAAVDDFYAILSSPEQSPRVIRELDEHGLWELLVPDWPHIRGRLPRERSHVHAIDAHSIATLARCARERTTVARPDLLLLTALLHDVGKGYGRPHEQVGAEIVVRQADRMRMNLADRSRAQTIVAEHTTLARLAARMDPYSDEARDALLDAARYDPLVVSLLAVLARADAESTGPGVWNSRLAQAIDAMCGRALAALEPGLPVRPHVAVPDDEVGLRVDWEEQLLTVVWRGEYQREVVRVLALVGAVGWTIVAARMVRTAGGRYAAEFDIRTTQQTLESAADEQHFIQSYKSGAYSTLPEVHGAPTTAVFGIGGILEVRTVERIGALGHLIGALPDVEWLSHQILGDTMIVQSQPLGPAARTTVVGNVTRALASD